MDNEKIKSILLELENTEIDFSVIQTGKERVFEIKAIE